MNYEDRLENVSVLGAAGKMGSGILLLTALELADARLREPSRSFVLNAIDISHSSLNGLLMYLRSQVQRVAESSIVRLRASYADREDLVDNGEIIQQYVSDVLSLVRPSTVLHPAFESTLIFEGVHEHEDLKVQLLHEIEEHNSRKPWYLTNTSSIPIHILDERGGLGGRIIGFHFYNPPAVQKLVELIPAATTEPELTGFAEAYAKRLRKTVVFSSDIAGFIGNGHFMRDILHALSESEALEGKMPRLDAIYAMNRVSQDWLIRPMGAFQLIDYVGIDVCSFILSVMAPHFPSEKLQSPLLNALLNSGIRGGQNSDGTQKNGIFRYEQNRPAGVYDIDSGSYVALEEIKARVDSQLGELPPSHLPWKRVVAIEGRDSFFKNYFSELKCQNSEGSRLARRYAERSKKIGQTLVTSGVARSAEDVNTVLRTGFYHAYGPVNEYLD